MAIPNYDWWKDPSSWTNLGFNVSDFASANEAPAFQNMAWNPGDSYVGVQNNPDNNALDFMPTAWGQSPMMSTSNNESNYRFFFDGSGNVTGGIAKIGDKVGQKFTTSIGEDGAVSLIPTEQVEWDTGNSFQNKSLLGLLGTAALGATGATMFPDPGVAAGGLTSSGGVGQGSVVSNILGQSQVPGAASSLSFGAPSGAYATPVMNGLLGQSFAAPGAFSGAGLFGSMPADVLGAAGTVAEIGKDVFIPPPVTPTPTPTQTGTPPTTPTTKVPTPADPTGLSKVLSDLGLPDWAKLGLLGGGALASYFDAKDKNGQFNGFMPAAEGLMNQYNNPNWYTPQFSTGLAQLPQAGRITGYNRMDDFRKA